MFSIFLSFYGQTLPRDGQPLPPVTTLRPRIEFFVLSQKCPNGDYPPGSEKVFPLMTCNYALCSADIPSSKGKSYSPVVHKIVRNAQILNLVWLVSAFVYLPRWHLNCSALPTSPTFPPDTGVRYRTFQGSVRSMPSPICQPQLSHFAQMIKGGLQNGNRSGSQRQLPLAAHARV